MLQCHVNQWQIVIGNLMSCLDFFFFFPKKRHERKKRYQERNEKKIIVEGFPLFWERLEKPYHYIFISCLLDRCYRTGCWIYCLVSYGWEKHVTLIHSWIWRFRAGDWGVSSGCHSRGLQGREGCGRKAGHSCGTCGLAGGWIRSLFLCLFLLSVVLCSFSSSGFLNSVCAR